MEWTVLEAKRAVERMEASLSDSDVFLTTESLEALDYLIETAKKYTKLKAELESITLKIQVRDS